MRLELHPEARAELRSAALWYDERRPGLGDEFIAEVSAALDRIGDTPESYPAWPGTRGAGPLIRKGSVQRFPYLGRVRKAPSIFARAGCRPRQTPATLLVHAREPLSETAAHDTRLRLSSCRIHSTTRFQLAPVWSTNLTLSFSSTSRTR